MNKIFILMLVVVLAGCAKNVTKQPTTIGFEEDGIIKVFYSYNRYEKPNINWAQILRKAKIRCVNWGYKNASPLWTARESKCEVHNDHGCIHWKISRHYKCVGKIN